MKIVSKEQMQAIDRRAEEDYGISSLVLMEQAGEVTTNFLLEKFGEKARYLILAGTGNNGGDALVVARRLLLKGARVWTYLVGKRDNLSVENKINLSIYEKLGGEVVDLEILDEKLSMVFMVADVIVDGLLGIGIERELKEPLTGLVDKINQSDAKVVSLDIPTGIHASSGEILGYAVKADYTITFGLPKLGHYIYPGASYVGELFVEQLSFPPQLLFDNSIFGQVTDLKELPKIKRFEDSHKGSYGKALLIAGSFGMSGAAALTGEAALRTGGGLIQAVAKKEIIPILQQMVPEMTIKEYDSDNIPDLTGINCIMVGPGWGVTHENKQFLRQIIQRAREKKIPLVLDADALTLIASDEQILHKDFFGPTVLTPHPGEMSRLVDKDISLLLRNRIGWAQTLARETNTVVVLKGAHTIIADTDGTFYINPTGNNGMATAGSGDVLTGVVGGLLMQGAALLEAAVLGVYLHGLAGDLGRDNIGARSLLARDIIRFLPKALKMYDESLK